MKVTLKTICDSAFTSKEGGNLNIIGIFENIIAAKFPATYPRVCFVFSLAGNPGQSGKYWFDITDSKGEKIVDLSAAPREYILGPNGRINLISNLIGLKVPREGAYSANFHFEGLDESIEFNALSKER